MTVGSRQRVRVRVEGTVQGVGFRPFVYRLAAELDLAGWVLNDSRGVLIEAEGEPGALAQLLGRLRSDAPPLAFVERMSDEPLIRPASRVSGSRRARTGGEPMRRSRPMWRPATSVSPR